MAKAAKERCRDKEGEERRGGGGRGLGRRWQCYLEQSSETILHILGYLWPFTLRVLLLSSLRSSITPDAQQRSNKRIPGPYAKFILTLFIWKTPSCPLLSRACPSPSGQSLLNRAAYTTPSCAHLVLEKNKETCKVLSRKSGIGATDDLSLPTWGF